MSRVARILLTLTLALLPAASAWAQINDNCGTATPITDGVYPGSNTTATTGPDPTGLCGGQMADVWYAYTATCNGTATAEFCGLGSANFDTVLAAFSGTCGCLKQLACNDDFCGLQSHITFEVLAGSVYYISAGGFFGSTGTFVLSVGCTASLPGPVPPSNDLCSGATILSEGVIASGNNQGATSYGCPSDNPVVTNCGFATDHDVWFVVVPTCSGPYQATTCLPGTGLDTVIGVWDGTGGCGGLVPINCDDNTCNLPNQYTSSTVTWMANAGTPYFISVAGYFGQMAPFSLLVTPGGGSISLNFTTGGPGSIGYSVLGAPPGGLIFTAVTLSAGAYPSGWFFGLDIAFFELQIELNQGFPFVTAASPCGSSFVGPFPGLPSGLTVYGVALGVPVGASFPTAISAPTTFTVP